MKKLTYILFILLITFYSCDSFLDVRPTGEVVNNELFETAEGYEEALYGVYSFLAREPLYGKNMTYGLVDVVGQYFAGGWDAHWSHKLREYDYKHMEVRPEIDAIWESMYKGISYVNNMLENLAERDSSAFALYNVYKAEGLGLRAFMHFELLRLFSESIIQNPEATGIPYREKYSYQVTPFDPIKVSYEKIIRDFKEAERLLTAHGEYFDREDENAGGFIKDRVIHMNLYAVQALLARVYWEKGDLETAKNYAMKVIECPFFKMEEKTEVEDMVNGVISNKETIWGLYSEEFPNFTREVLYQNGGSFTYDPKPDYRDIYEVDQDGFDYRLDKWFQTLSDHGAEGLRCMKVVDRFKVRLGARPVSKLSGINMIRLPELYYIVAEYYLVMDNVEMAATYLDKVVRARGLNGFNKGDGIVVVSRMNINNDRRKELVCEGQWFQIMKHYNMSIYESITDQTFQPSKNIYVFPVPDDEYEYRN